MSIALARKPSRSLLGSSKVKNKSKGNSYRGNQRKRLPGLPGGAWLCNLMGWSATFLLGAAFFAAISVGLLAAYRWTTTTGVFALSAIEINGNVRLSDGEVLQSAQVRIGQNCLDVKMNEVEASLAQNPWIERVYIKRVLPGTLEIGVTEREPRFWVRKDDGLYYADRAGRIIARVEPGKFESLPQLVLAEGSEHLVEKLSTLLAEMRRSDLPFDPEEASWVRLSPQHGVEIFQEDGGRSITVGVEDWTTNLARLRKVWEDLDRRGELGEIRRIRAHGKTVWVYRSRRDAHSA